MILNFTLLLCTLASLSLSRITEGNRLESTQITTNDLSSFSEVLVQASFNYIDNGRYEKIYLCVKASNKHKKQAYVDLLKKYNGIVRTLVKLKAIPNEEAMIHSIVHRRYHQKNRKWEFFRSFVVYALKEDISFILQKLKIFHPEKIRANSMVHYFDERFMSIAAFIEAKLELKKFIKEHLNNEYKILLTKDIEIIGQPVVNKKMFEENLEAEVNELERKEVEEFSDSNGLETKEIEEHYDGFHKNGFQRYHKNLKKFEIKVLFQLVEKSADIEDILEGIEERGDESQSISDFEYELKNEEWSEEVSESFEDDDL